MQFNPVCFKDLCLLDKVVRTPKRIHLFFINREEACIIKSKTAGRILHYRIKYFSRVKELIDLPTEVVEGFKKQGMIWFLANTPPNITFHGTMISVKPTADRAGVRFALKRLSLEELVKQSNLKE